MPRRSPWTFRRILALTLSLVLLGFGVKCLWDGHRHVQRFEQWQRAKPMEGTIDLSAPGRFVFAFEQTCSMSHGEAVVLRLPPEALPGTNLVEALDLLNAQLQIVDKSGTSQAASVAVQVSPQGPLPDGAIPIFHLAPFRKGTYQAIITVEAGVPALKGLAQRVEGRYLLCGLERLPGTIMTAVGVVTTGLGSIIGIIVWVLLRSGRKPAPEPAEPVKT